MYIEYKNEISNDNANEDLIKPIEEDFKLKKDDFFISFQPFCILTIPILLTSILYYLESNLFISFLLLIFTIYYFRKISLVGKYNKARHLYNSQKRLQDKQAEQELKKRKLFDKQIEQETKKRQQYGMSYDEILAQDGLSDEQRKFFLEHSQYEKNLSKMFLLLKSRLGENFQPIILKKVSQAYKTIQEVQAQNNLNMEMKVLSAEEINAIVESLNFTTITKVIEIPKSGQKGKLAFLNTKGNPTTTEYACKEYFEMQGYKVMRAEVNFWQALFGIAFFEEIYSKNWDKINDIPLDLFTGGHFYNIRKELIDKKYIEIKNCTNLCSFINNQIENFGFFYSRLLYNRTEIDIQYCKKPIVQEFFNIINPSIFADIIYRIAQNVNDNRAGLPDYIVWKNNEITFVEVKRLKEKIRESQINWISFLRNNNIPVSIVRVKGV